MRQMANKKDSENVEKIYPDIEDEVEETNKNADSASVGKFVRRASRRLSRQMSQLKTGKEVQKQSDKTDESDDDLPKIDMWRIIKRNRPEYGYIFIGVLASGAMGAVMPLFGIIFGDVLGVLAYEDADLARKESITYALWFVALGVFAFLTQFIQVNS